jgi:glycosyltransferase involved in cell wall biosynthesis
MYKIYALFLIFCFNQVELLSAPKKIIGLIPERNESNILGECLKALSKFTDEIIILDDCSTDNSVEIAKSLANECKVVEIIEKKKWYRDESGDRNLLLEAGRKHKGTHFIVIDADEILTGYCIEHNRLRSILLSLRPGEQLSMHWYQLWRSFDNYRNDGIFAPVKSVWCFCDDGTCSYNKSYLHTPRVPQNLNGKVYPLPAMFGIIHFQFVQWENLLIKQAWYRCLERIREPQKSITAINEMYQPSKDETGLTLNPVPAYWFSAYPMLDKSCYLKPETWRKKQIAEWFDKYGPDYFKELDIWDVNWFD